MRYVKIISRGWNPGYVHIHTVYSRILLLATFITVTMYAYATGPNRISLNKKDASLINCLLEIRKQAGISFTMDAQWGNLTKPVTINVTNAKLSVVLEIIFKDQPLEYELDKDLIIISLKKQMAVSDRLNIEGTVAIENEEPVEGVVVTAIEDNKTTTTDHYGRFRINNIDNNATLSFAGVNLAVHEMKLNGKTFIRVLLKPCISIKDETTATPSNIP